MEMGRHKTVNVDLPPRMASRTLKSGKVLFYYQSGRKKIPLGADLAKARVQWAIYENGVDSQVNFKAVAERYGREVLPSKSWKTQGDQYPQLDRLVEAFGRLPLELIQPKHVREYIDRRTAKIQANREKALLSHLWNWARQVGLTDRGNPCLGVKGNREFARERYVTDTEFAETYAKADDTMRDFMDLLLLTGQRSSDVLKMTRADLRDGCLWVRQGKTGARVGVRVEGELKATLDRILGRPSTVRSLAYLIHDNGQRIRAGVMSKRFAKVRVGNWQLRDLRAKAATDSPDIKTAQNLLGHRRETTTAAVYRRMKGNVVGPLK